MAILLKRAARATKWQIVTATHKVRAYTNARVELSRQALSKFNCENTECLSIDLIHD